MGASSSNVNLSGEPLNSSEMDQIKQSWDAIEDKNLLGDLRYLLY